MALAQTRQLQPEPPRGILGTGAPPAPGRHVRYLPSDDLAEYIEHFWVVEWNLPRRMRHRVATLPHPSVHITIGPRQASLNGVHHGRFSRYLTGTSWVFGIKFHPGGFHPFLGRPVSSISDQVIPLGRFTPLGPALRSAVRQHQGDEARAEAVEAMLRATKPAPDPRVLEVRELVARIRRDSAIRRVDDILQGTGLGKRALQRLFERYVGVNPKWVIQRYRLHEAAERLAAGAIQGSRLAAELGYADQAHFIRDFKQVVGVAPGRYMRNIR